jgi:hypothetical protein
MHACVRIQRLFRLEKLLALFAPKCPVLHMCCTMRVQSLLRFEPGAAQFARNWPHIHVRSEMIAELQVRACAKRTMRTVEGLGIFVHATHVLQAAILPFEGCPTVLAYKRAILFMHNHVLLQLTWALRGVVTTGARELPNTRVNKCMLGQRML